MRKVDNFFLVSQCFSAGLVVKFNFALSAGRRRNKQTEFVRVLRCATEHAGWQTLSLNGTKIGFVL